MNKELTPLEWNNQRVFTTEMLTEYYKADRENIKSCFNRNKDRFIKGEHYYELTGQELKEFSNYLQDNNSELKIYSRTRSLMLWTEKGILKYAKMLRTDRAWDVCEQLEDAYFRMKEELIEEQKINAIEDEKERNIRLKIFRLKKILELNPDDIIVIALLNQANTELEIYLQNKNN